MNISSDIVESRLLNSKKSRRRRILIVTTLGVILVAASVGLWRLSITPIKIAVSPETTRETEPLRADGWLDFPTIINRRASAGVSNEENSAIELWHAIGPVPDGTPMEFYKKLCAEWGIEPLPIAGDYFATFQNFVRSVRRPDEPLATSNELANLIERATQAPWRAEELPDVTRWLEANRGPLEIVHCAVRKPKYFRPAIVKPDQLLMDAFLPDVQTYRGVSDALCSRAMLRAANQDFDGAFEDIATTHHLARQVSRGSFCIEFMVALSIQRKAFDCEARLLNELPLSAEQARSHREHSAEMVELRHPADLLDFADRFMILDLAHAILTERTEDTKLRDIFSRLLWRFVDWSPALVEIQTSIDQAVETLKTDAPSEFHRRCDDLEKKLSSERLRNLLGQVRMNDFLFRRRELAKRMGRGIAAELMPAFPSIWDFAKGNQSRAEMLRLSYALLEYRVRNGRFPDQVNWLIPELLETVPNDGFTGSPFIVTLTESSFVIRSVGVDGVIVPDDAESSDDIVVRFDAASRSAAAQPQDDKDH